MKKFLMMILAVVMSVGFVCADYYVKTKIHTDPVSIMGQNEPAKDEISEQWIGNNQFASHTKDRSFIVDLNKNVMFTINHKNKTYIEMDLPLETSKYFPEQMQQMMKGMMDSMTVTITPNGKKKQIKQWNCDGYDVDMNVMMMKMKMNIWTTTDVRFDWKMVGDKMMAHVKKISMRLSEKVLKEFEKIKGFQIATEMNMNIMGGDIKTTSVVQEISEKTPAGNVYAVDKTYKKQEKFSMQDMQNK